MARAAADRVATAQAHPCLLARPISDRCPPVRCWCPTPELHARRPASSASTDRTPIWRATNSSAATRRPTPGRRCRMAAVRAVLSKMRAASGSTLEPLSSQGDELPRRIRSNSRRRLLCASGRRDVRMVWRRIRSFGSMIRTNGWLVGPVSCQEESSAQRLLTRQRQNPAASASPPQAICAPYSLVAARLDECRLFLRTPMQVHARVGRDGFAITPARLTQLDSHPVRLRA